jgi:pyrroloquinoline quinone (PQQ) biosynthesis protein C
MSQVLETTGMVGGSALSDDEAKKAVQHLYDVTFDVCDRYVTKGQFITELSAGTLPPEALRIFWLNWSGFVSEINNFIQCAYQRHLGFFKQHIDLLTPFADKVADELIHPRAPGHLLVVWEQGEVFGISRDEMLNYEMLPECRAMLDWHRGLLYEGTLIEFWAAIVYEEYIGHWAKMFREGMATMGYASERAPYFHTHEEADLVPHEGGVMGHGEFNRAVIERLHTTGNLQHRPGLSAGYCARLGPYYFGKFHQACLDAAK